MTEAPPREQTKPGTTTGGRSRRSATSTTPKRPVHGKAAGFARGFAARFRRSLQAFTTYGVVVTVTGVALWIVAIVLGWREAAVLAGICLVLTIVAILSTLGKDSLLVNLTLAKKRVTVGEPAVGTVLATNPTARRLVGTKLEVPVGRGAVQLAVPSLQPGRSAEDIVIIPTDKRSVITVGPARTVKGDPLGLARREFAWSSTIDLYVHPRTVRLAGSTSGLVKDLEGQSRNDLSSSDVVFHTLREYVPGDDQRHIHWKTYARLGTLMVRQFVDTRRSELALVASTLREEYASDEEFELAISVVGSIGRSAISDEQGVSCVMGGRVIPCFANEVFLDTLASVVADDADILRTAQRARGETGRASVVLLISGSQCSLAALRASADRSSTAARVIILRIVAGTAPQLQMAGQHTLLTLGSLKELAAVLRKATS